MAFEKGTKIPYLPSSRIEAKQECVRIYCFPIRQTIVFVTAYNCQGF